MEELIRSTVRRVASSRNNPDRRRRLKKIIVGAIVAIVVFIIIIVTLIILGIGWLMNQAGQTGQTVIDQGIQSVTKTSNPLDLQSYISNGVVDVSGLQNLYNGLPAIGQSMLLAQFGQQLQNLQQQAGVSDQTIKSLTDLLNSLKAQNVTQ